MNIKIQPIPYGLNKQAIFIEPIWGETPFFGTDFCLKLNFKDEYTNYLYEDIFRLSREDYEALGETKEEKFDNWLNKIGISRV